MPYIEAEKREILQPLVKHLALVPGELNYQITSMILGYMQERGLNYTTINDIIGVLENVKLEFTRRIVVPYEDMKIKANGDVYPTLTYPQ